MLGQSQGRGREEGVAGPGQKQEPDKGQGGAGHDTARSLDQDQDDSDAAPGLRRQQATGAEGSLDHPLALALPLCFVPSIIGIASVLGARAVTLIFRLLPC